MSLELQILGDTFDTQMQQLLDNSLHFERPSSILEVHALLVCIQ